MVIIVIEHLLVLKMESGSSTCGASRPSLLKVNKNAILTHSPGQSPIGSGQTCPVTPPGGPCDEPRMGP